MRTQRILALGAALSLMLSLAVVLGASGGEPLAVTSVDTVGMTVSDMERAVAFYTSVLTFEKVSDVEVSGREYELLEGVFGARMRIVRLQLGAESIELTEYLTPKGRPVRVDMRPRMTSGSWRSA